MSSRREVDLPSLSPKESISYMENYYFPPYITLAHTFNAPKGWHAPVRYLKHYALQYVAAGEADYEIGGHVYRTLKGDVVVHRPYEQNAIRTIEGKPYVCISLLFHFGDSDFPFDALFDRDHYCGNYVNHPVDRMLAQLITHYKQPGLHNQMTSQSLLLQVLAELSKWKREQEAPPGKQRQGRAKMVLIRNFIHEHYNREIQFEELENVSNLSRSYIIPLFRETYGLSPMQYQIWLRVKAAKELAIQSGLSISEIANVVGYADVHSFGKMFKKKTGHSLSDFCGTLTTGQGKLDRSRYY